MVSDMGHGDLFDEVLDAEEVWFEDDLEPAQASLDGVIKELTALDDATLAEALAMPAIAGWSKGRQSEAIETFVLEEARSQVRINWPRTVPVTTGTGMAGLVTGTPYLVRLGVEYVLAEKHLEAKYRYKKVWCRARLAADDPHCLPRVLDVLPDRLYEGEPQRIRVEIKPALKLEQVEAGLGSIATDIQVGVVAPATLGYLGEDDRAPYWVMTEKSREIRGRYHFWFLLDVPDTCDPASIHLTVEGEGNMRFHMLNLPLGPKRRRTGQQSWLTLAEIAGRGGG